MQTWTYSQPLPSRACVALPAALACDAMAGPLEAAELLDVDVDQFAGLLALVAAHRLGRLEGREAVQAGALEDAADGRRRDPGGLGDLLAREALAAQGHHLLDNGRARRPTQTLRPRRAVLQSVEPSATKRATHLRAVRGQTPAARAAASGVCPPSTLARTKRSRPSGVRRAFLWMFIRSSEETLKLRNSSFLAPDRMDNLLKAHT